MSFLKKLQHKISAHNSLLCIGLDPDLEKIPSFLGKTPQSLFIFNKAIIDATCDLACVYKPNSAFYEAYGIPGWQALEQTIAYIHTKDLPVILDAKRGDIGNTAQQYAKACFDSLQADAVTINAYMGSDAVEPFLAYQEKYSFVLVKTSNPSSVELQDQKLVNQQPVYRAVAKKVLEWNQQYHNCGMVLGATFPQQLAEIRGLSEETWILVPGIGRQGGDLAATLQAGLNKKKQGLLLVVARDIIYASADKDFAEKARQTANGFRQHINQYSV